AKTLLREVPSEEKEERARGRVRPSPLASALTLTLHLALSPLLNPDLPRTLSLLTRSRSFAGSGASWRRYAQHFAGTCMQIMEYAGRNGPGAQSAHGGTGGK